MKLFLSIFLALVMVTLGHAQSDNESTSDETPIIRPGIYITFNNFITNSPIDPATIVTNRDHYDADFYFQLFKEGKIEFIRDSVFNTFDPLAIWGYSDGRSIFINRWIYPQGFFDKPTLGEHNFDKIQFLGELSLVYFVKLNYGAGYPYGPDSSNSKIAEYILDARDGKIHKSTLNNLEDLLVNDKELLSEFQKTAKSRDVKFYLFLKKYNDRHPFKFR
jgi:hypothetical protein